MPSTGEDGKWLQEIAGEKAGVVTSQFHTKERETHTVATKTGSDGSSLVYQSLPCHSWLSPWPVSAATARR